MFQNVYNILVEILGPSKQGYYSSDIEQYQFNCCRCAEDNDGVSDGKHNLEILLSPQRGLKYHCWKCGDTDNMRGRLEVLIKKYGNSTQYRQYKEEIQTIKTNRMYDINFFGNDTEYAVDDIIIKLPKSYKKIELDSLPNNKLKRYILSRGFTQDIIDKYNIGYTEWDDPDWTMRSKIIVPSYDSYGDLNYFVGRDYSGKSKIKYKNCDADKKEIIFQESLIDWDSNVYLVEGALDCLFIPGAISMLGKSLSRDSLLYKTLIKKSNGKIVICLDGDTTIDETKRIYNMLNFGRLRNKIYYIRLGGEDIPYKDFGELFVAEGKKGMINAVRSMKQFDEIDLIY